MRQLKFRAWDKERKEMLPIKLMDFSQWWVSCDPSYKNLKPFDYGERNSFKNDETDRHIIMQYTGLKDKNGKEIYEGDILQYRNLGTQGHHWQWTRDENGKEKLGGEIKYEGYVSKGAVRYYEGAFKINICYLHEIFQRDGNLGEHRESVHGMTSKTVTTYAEFEVIGNIYENPELLEV